MLGLAEPSLMHGGRTMREYSEAFVAFDVAKTKHAVAIADGGRSGEVRFVGEIASSPAAVERLIRKLADRLASCISATRQARRDTGCIARSKRSDTPAWWSRQP